MGYFCDREEKGRLEGVKALVLTAAFASSVCLLSSCSLMDPNDTSGPPYTLPASVEMSSFDSAAASKAGKGYIDTSNSSKGYVGASVTSSSRCKFQVMKDDVSYNYDIPSDGSPIVVPINMGDGEYTFRIMQNSSGSNYIEIGSDSASVVLDTEFEPYLRPDIFCEYTPESACVAKAYELAEGAENEGDVVKAIYDWIASNITYDKSKAAELADATGYIPSPDSTLESGSGICFDYASLAAAMFRSLGIPCQIVTGYVEPNNLYHAWNMVYIDGEWIGVDISVEPDTWSRIDLTFAAASADSAEYVGDGAAYTDRYIY